MSTFDPDNFDPENPEHIEALERAQQLEDGEVEDPTKAGGETQTGTTETAQAGNATETNSGTAAQTEQSGQASETTESAQEPATKKVEGIASKDGKHVLPYSALVAARGEARRRADNEARLAAELAKAQKQIDDLRSGKAKDDLGEAELEEIAADVPGAKKLVDAFKATKAQLDELQKQAPARTTEEEPAHDPVLEAMDQVPELVEWQTNPAHADKFQRAIALDEALKESPKWKGKPMADRFAHVAKLVAEEFDIADPTTQGTSSTTAPAKTATGRADPNKVIAAAGRAAPNTLSDFKGGASADPQSDNLDRMPPQKAVGRAMSMSDAEIDDWLRKQG